MFCKYCGASIETSSKYCPACGKPLSSDTSEGVKTTPSWFKIFVVFIVALALGVVWLFYSTPDLTHTVEGQLTALRQNKISEAYYEYTSKEFQSTTSLDAFRQFLKSHPILLETKSIEIDEHKVEDNIGSLKGTLTSAAEETALIQYYLIKEGDRWKILRIEISPSIQKAAAESKKILSLVEEPQGKPQYAATEKKNPYIDVIEHFLNGLKKHQLDESYKYVTKEFKAATPLSQFEVYVKNTPILSNFSSFSTTEANTQGNDALIKIVLDPSKGAIPVEFHLENQNGEWKIWSFRVVLPSREVPLPMRDTALLIPPIKSMLKALQAKNYKDAYEAFTQNYKEKVSLEAFENAVKKDPLLTHQQISNFKEPRIEDTNGTVIVELSEGSADKEKSSESLEFLLKLDNGQWKIDEWKLLEPAQQPPSKGKEGINAKDLEAVVNDQIKAIQAKDMEKAYAQYTSQGFKEITSLAEFKDFIEKHPYISVHKQMNLQLTFDNNIPILRGTIATDDQHLYEIEYQFVKEKENWKILHIDVTGKNYEKTSSGTVEFTKVLIGRKIDTEGLVKDPQTVLKADKEEIYINLFIKNSAPDAKIELQLEHLQTGSTTPQISTTLKDRGESIVSFIFSSPPQGWPKGIYQVHAKSSTGAFQIFMFNMD